MKQTVFIGYEKSIGSFPDKQTGEIVRYSNRTLKFITNAGSDNIRIGYDFFEEEKVKLADLARYLNVRDDDEAVNSALDSLLQKNVEVIYAPRKGKQTLVGLNAVKATPHSCQKQENVV